MDNRLHCKKVRVSFCTVLKMAKAGSYGTIGLLLLLWRLFQKEFTDGSSLCHP